MIERGYSLFVLRKTGENRLSRDFEDSVRKGDLEKANSMAEKMARESVLGTVVAAGTQAALHMGGREEIQGKMDAVLLTENARLNRRTSYLAMLGNTATLLGLLGTIVGMIKSFAGIANADPVERSAVLAAGISEAMNATAYGLIVAIPALVTYTILQSRAQRLSEELNENSLRALNLLAFNQDMTAAKIKSKKA
ncbi:MAG: MotA/TolQ/ExbB proton channel family protein [Bdellovibrionaceae bacterium]|nr:MotA/TolQ/ExbB proton channel family protein [Pseudobdellovibrionaceae bacterium]